MNYGELISILINIGVGLYFAHYYPRTLRRRLDEARLPPLFALLLKVLPPLGWLLIIASVGYAIARLLLGYQPI